jgi:hypothetical protein
VGPVIAVNPTSPVRGPKYSVKKGKTAVLWAVEARTLLDSIVPFSPVALRDRVQLSFGWRFPLYGQRELFERF